jgi:hypothetical protein
MAIIKSYPIPQTGQKIKKSDFTGLASKFSDLVIDQDNIREEGLDERVIRPQNCVGNRGSVNVYNATLNQNEFFQQHKDNYWRNVTFRYDAEDGSVTDSAAAREAMFASPTGMIQSSQPWNPEFDSYIIIRCSFECTTKYHRFRDSENHINELSAIDFGLRVKRPNVDDDDPLNELNSGRTTSGAIFPYQRMYLNEAFSEHAVIEKDDTDPEIYRSYQSDLRSNMHQSFTLLFCASSFRDTTLANFYWSSPGNWEAQLMCRSSANCYGNGLGGEDDFSFAVGNYHMSSFIYKR